MKGKVIVMLLAMTVAGGAVSGCGSTNDGEYRVMEGVGHGLYHPQVEAYKMVDACQLTPPEILMIDICSHWFMKQVRGMTCDQVRVFLDEYRQTEGDEPRSLFHNPALTAPASLDGIMYAALSTDVPTDGLYFGERGRNSGVFVDFVDSEVRFGFDYVVYGGPGGMKITLTPAGRAAFQAELAPLLKWGGQWTTPSDDDLALYSWTVAIVTADSQLYRWSGTWHSQRSPERQFMQPEGFKQVHQAFWALTNQ